MNTRFQVLCSKISCCIWSTQESSLSNGCASELFFCVPTWSENHLHRWSQRNTTLFVWFFSFQWLKDLYLYKIINCECYSILEIIARTPLSFVKNINTFHCVFWHCKFVFACFFWDFSLWLYKGSTGSTLLIVSLISPYPLLISFLLNFLIVE